jgi:ArsR family transcriptional regulator, arsenate/arsenite/antimonite-responsive transcriptional repressor
MAPRRMTPDQRAKIFKALSDPRRVDMVDLLAKHGAMCGTQLAEDLGISIAMVSHHWEVLIEAGIVRKHREGQLRYCVLDSARIREATEGWDACQAPCIDMTPKPRAKAKKPAKKPVTA